MRQNLVVAVLEGLPPPASGRAARSQERDRSRYSAQDSNVRRPLSLVGPLPTTVTPLLLLRIHLARILVGRHEDGLAHPRTMRRSPPQHLWAPLRACFITPTQGRTSLAPARPRWTTTARQSLHLPLRACRVLVPRLLAADPPATTGGMVLITSLTTLASSGAATATF